MENNTGRYLLELLFPHIYLFTTRRLRHYINFKKYQKFSKYSVLWSLNVFIASRICVALAQHCPVMNHVHSRSKHPQTLRHTHLTSEFQNKRLPPSMPRVASGVQYYSDRASVNTYLSRRATCYLHNEKSNSCSCLSRASEMPLPIKQSAAEVELPHFRSKASNCKKITLISFGVQNFHNSALVSVNIPLTS